MKKAVKSILIIFVCAVLLTTNLLVPVGIASSGIYELAFENLFVFEQWASNTVSCSCPSADGALTANISSGSFTLTNNASSGEVYTAASMDTNPAGNAGYYTVPVEPNTSYTLSYELSSDSSNTEDFVFFFNSENAFITLLNHLPSSTGAISRSFITPENTSHLQLRFDVNAPGCSATVSNIRIYKTNAAAVATQVPSRSAYTYSSGATYGELPTPEKDGFVFAGWFTEANGAGTLITAETELLPYSTSVFADWHPIVNEIALVSEPVKQNYFIGEKLNTTGLIISVTYPNSTTENIDEGFICSPAYLTQAGTQAVTVSYGGKTTEFTVNVVESAELKLVVNSSELSAKATNNTYTLNYSGSAFNRYELTYSSDAYVKALMTMGSVTEEFFLEPAQSGTFSGYIDGFLSGTTQSAVTSISFEPLNKDELDFEFISLSTSQNTIPENMVYLSSNDYKIGIDLAWGGALTYLEDLTNSVTSSVRKYTNKVTTVDFESKSETGLLYNTSSNVNLINAHDTGRLVQQSYYGTASPPYECGSYNGTTWNYNPVQGGNLYNEASKIVDLRVTENQIYIKCRPLDWAKSAADITPSYMEAWYTLEDGLMKATCRFVDFSGYPQATTTQELPAFYCVEPLNTFVYYSGGEPWSESNTRVTDSDLQFWGDYPDQFSTCNENWAAFTGPDSDSFGIGLYCPGQTNFLAGVFSRGTCETVSPATENPTSYIAAVDTFTFKSYNPVSYAYYITTGTVDTIRSNFKALGESAEDTCNGSYTNGFCDMCGRYQKPAFSTDKYDLNNDSIKDKVYEIANAGQLYWFSEAVNNGATSANAVLVNDIVVNQELIADGGTLNTANAVYGWSPIGNSTCKFNGIFDGQGYTISGLYFNSQVYYAALFGYTASDAIIREIGLTDSYINGDWYVGAVCGDNYGTITNCFSTRSIIIGNVGSAGIAAANESGAVISNCYSTASMYGTSYVGGICGYNPGTIANCFYLEGCAVNSNGTSQQGIGGDTEGFVEDISSQTERKTLSEFNSGEVAHKLQAGNSEQIWGQKSTTEYSAPVFDYTGKYSVSANGGCNAFCLVTIGDLEGDEDIDAADYQALVNMALSSDEPTYPDMLSADLDGDGYVDAIDCSVMALLVNGLREGIGVFPAGDFDCDGIPFTQADISLIKKGLLNPHTLSTRQKFACDLNFDGTLNSADREILNSVNEPAAKALFAGNASI